MKGMNRLKGKKSDDKMTSPTFVRKGKKEDGRRKEWKSC